MADIIPFRRKRSWTRPEDYGHHPKRPSGGGGGPPDNGKQRGKRRGKLARLWPWALLIAIITLWVLRDPAAYEPPAFLSGAPETVERAFQRCGPDNDADHCVIDGGTFRLGNRQIRLIGIDAPQTAAARCPAEAGAGEAATAELLRLLNQGPFVISGRFDAPRDRDGRELRAASRQRADGSIQSIAADMRGSGTVRRHLGGLRRSWCPAEK
jgi:micrococcal nuclease